MASLPNLLVIGAQKCGTTSLHGYLSLHPQVSMAKRKELDFFVRPEDSIVAIGNWHRGLDWYRAQFQGSSPVRGEASPNYTGFPHFRGVPERAARVLPEAKLICMVRDPIERIVSHYMHRRAAGMEARPLEQTLGDIETEAGAIFVYRSMYFMQLERWLQHFPRERLLVVAQEDLLSDRARTLRRVFRFLGVDDAFESPGFSARREVSADKRARGRLGRTIAPPLERAGRALPEGVRVPAGDVFRRLTGRGLERPGVSTARRAQLESLLREDVERLRGLTGQRFGEWSM